MYFLATTFGFHYLAEVRWVTASATTTFPTNPQVNEGTVGEPGWFYGSCQGKLGWFPQSYVEKCPPGEAANCPDRKSVV